MQGYDSRCVPVQVKVLCYGRKGHDVEEVEVAGSRNLAVALETAHENISQVREMALDHRLCTEMMEQATRLENVTGMVLGILRASTLGNACVGLARVLENDLNSAHAGLEKRHASKTGNLTVEQAMLRVIWLAASRAASETQLAGSRATLSPGLVRAFRGSP